MSLIKSKELVLFGLVGVVGYAVDVFATSMLHEFVNVYLARVPAFFAAATATWFLNRSLTFRSRSITHTSLIQEYLHYLSLMVIGLIVNYLAYAITISLIPQSPYSILISVAVGSLTGMASNFHTSKKYIYK